MTFVVWRREGRLLNAMLTSGLMDMKVLFKKLLREDSGATAIEYGLIASLIAVVIIGAITTVGTNMSNVFSEVASNIK
jgi:pilus assembly protein Flp/PilA